MRIVKLLIILLVIVVAGFLLYKIINTIRHKTAVEQGLTQLPAFTFYTLSDATFTNDSLEKNKSTVVIYFNTGCEHCRYETEQIIKHANELQHANFLMVSAQPVSDLKVFDSTYNISAHPFIRLLCDKENTIQQVFGANNIPSIFIYYKNDRLVKNYKGEVKAEAIIEAIR